MKRNTYDHLHGHQWYGWCFGNRQGLGDNRTSGCNRLLENGLHQGGKQTAMNFNRLGMQPPLRVKTTKFSGRCLTQLIPCGISLFCSQIRNALAQPVLRLRANQLSWRTIPRISTSTTGLNFVAVAVTRELPWQRAVTRLPLTRQLRLACPPKRAGFVVSEVPPCGARGCCRYRHDSSDPASTSGRAPAVSNCDPQTA